MTQRQYSLKKFKHSDLSGRQSGASLIEVLVALLVLSLGMLGMASLQTRGMQFNQSAYYLSQANLLAVDILDRMRASNFSNATINNFLHGMQDSVPTSYKSCLGGTSVNCSTTELAQYELYDWLEGVAAILPSGLASITEDASATEPVYIITIQYDDSKADSSTKYGQDNTIAPKQYIYRAEL